MNPATTPCQRMCANGIALLGSVFALVVAMIFSTTARTTLAQAQSAPKKRNVVLITFDDLRQDTPAFNGGPAKTPNMDRLAARSTNFRNAMTTVGLCSPSRATLFTGRYGHQTGLDDNCNVWHSRLTGLDKAQSSVIDWADDAGYFVGYFGKWHLGADGPIDRGADRFPKKGIERGRGPGERYRKPAGYDNIAQFYEPGRKFDEKPGYYGTRKGTFEQTSEHHDSVQAVEFLREAAEDDRPFFLCVNYHGPHPPYVVPAPYNHAYQPDAVRLPKNFLHIGKDTPRYQNDPLWYWHDVDHLTPLDWRKMNTYYWGFVTMVDRAVGLVLDSARDLQLMDNTLIVLVGDQGSMLGEHKLYDKGPYCYDELMRIPMLLYVPGSEGGVVHRQVSLIDVNQTIVDWLKLKPTGDERHSRSLLPLARDPKAGWQGIPDEAFYRYEWYNGKWYGVRAVRTPDWKYCWNPVGIDELYDLQKDPGEMTNLINAASATEPLRKLQKRLATHLEETDDPLLERFQQEWGF